MHGANVIFDATPLAHADAAHARCKFQEEGLDGPEVGRTTADRACEQPPAET
jgi:hypothetical protein